MIQGFWGDLPSLQSISEDDDKGYKKRFLSFWECLAPLYERFTNSLQAEGYVYDGAALSPCSRSEGRGT